MADSMDIFVKKFLEEATDLLADLEEALLQIEGDPENKELLDRIFRAMHTLKGGGAMFGFEKISYLTHHLETLYDKLREGTLELSNDQLSTTFKAVDLIKVLLFNPEKTNELDAEIEELIASLSSKSDSSVVADQSEQNQELKTFFITINLSADIFDNGTNPLFLIDDLAELGQIEAYPWFSIPDFQKMKPTQCYTRWDVVLATESSENDIRDIFIFVEDDCEIEINELLAGNLLEREIFVKTIEKLYSKDIEFNYQSIKEVVQEKPYYKPAAEKVSEKVSETVVQETPSSKNATAQNTISSIRVPAEKLDELMNLVSELVTTQARLSLFAENQESNELLVISENVQKLSRQLRDLAFNVSLIPVQSIVTRFQRLVRDLSGELGKKITFTVEGAETELDKTIIENLTDPLLHILRNSIDHGIETEEERIKKGKPATGKIHMKAYYSGANVHIQITDDGKGIDLVKVKEKAISKGMIAADSEPSKKELMDILFAPGFSTAKAVTDVSGRGVGMDVVWRKVHEIRGDIELDTEKDVGTTIIVKLPLTLSIIDGLLVVIDEVKYIMPLTVVQKCFAVESAVFKTNFMKSIALDGNQVPVHNLRQEFRATSPVPKVFQVITVEYDEASVGLCVDSIIGEYQAVLKPLGKMYKNQDIFSGASILGDGSVALVMDTNKMIKKFTKEPTEFN